MKRFTPDFYYETLEKISVSMLKQKQIKGLILDIDNTLVPPHTPICDARAKQFVENMQKDFKVCIVSNNIYERARRFAVSFPVDFVCDGNKPAKKPFRLALAKLQLEPQQVAVIGDQIFTDVWGAKRMGMLSVLVEPICSEEGKFIKLKRIFEKMVYNKPKQ